jgi:hypothetical protein
MYGIGITWRAKADTRQVGKAPTLLDGSLPNVARWFKAVQESKGWQFALEQGFGKF